MELGKAEQIATKLMQEHGLVGWRFSFGKTKKIAGLCNHRFKYIELSQYLTFLNTEEHVTNTILHEIAHALVGIGHGHDYIWKQKAREIGCDAERCYAKDTNRPEGKYKGTCINCGNVQYYHKQIRQNSHACSACCNKFNNGKFSLSYVRRIEHNDGYKKNTANLEAEKERLLYLLKKMEEAK
jgi:predicted SprT family Zn-dependent metalloprotease